ncbi:MAG: ArsR/SmtB family transcription factor, partial [Chloroflexota bacterium]
YPHAIILNSMVKYNEAHLDATFAALANPTRRGLLDRLAQGEATVGELAEPFKMSLAAVSKHLHVLEEAGLVQRRVVGREHHLSLEGAPIADVAAWLLRYRRFWQESLDALETYLEEDGPS